MSRPGLTMDGMIEDDMFDIDLEEEDENAELKDININTYSSSY